MRNPFNEKLSVLQTAPFVWNLTPANCTGLLIDMTEEKARYAAHAINQHEKLVKIIRMAQPWIQSQVEYTNTGVKDPFAVFSEQMAALLRAEEEAA